MVGVILSIANLTNATYNNNEQNKIEMLFVARSVLYELRVLEILQLSGTRATRLCNDWQNDMFALKRLYLADNNVTGLVLDDLKWQQRNLTVDLSGNPIENIVLNPDELRDLERPLVRKKKKPEVRK